MTPATPTPPRWGGGAEGTQYPGGGGGPKSAAPSPAVGGQDIPALTSWRGLLALSVVFYHFWNDAVRLFPWAEVLSPLVRTGHFAVPGFFMLSGFVLAYNYGERFARLNRREVVRFLAIRLARVYPVHLACLLVVLAMVVVSERLGYELTDAGYTAHDFVLNLLLIHTWVPHFTLNWNYPAWSVSSEWFAYLFFPITVRLGLSHLTTPFRAATAVSASLAAAIAVVLWWRPWPFYELVLVIPTFVCGAAAAWALRGRVDTGRSAVWSWAPEGLVVVTAAAALTLAPEVVGVALLVGTLGLLVALAWLGDGCRRVWKSWPVVYLGEVSYSLYMTHTLAQKVVNRVLPSSRFVTADPLTKLGVLAAYAALVMALCLGSYYLIERPCRLLFKKLARRPEGPPPPEAKGEQDRSPPGDVG